MQKIKKTEKRGAKAVSAALTALTLTAAATVTLFAATGCKSEVKPPVLPSGEYTASAGFTEVTTAAVNPVFDEDLDLARRMHSTDAEPPTWEEVAGIAAKFKELLATPAGVALTEETINPESFLKLSTDLGEINGVHVRVFEYNTMFEDPARSIHHPDWVFLQVITGDNAKVYDVTAGMQSVKLNSVHAVKNGFAVILGFDGGLNNLYLSTWLAADGDVSCADTAFSNNNLLSFKFSKVDKERITAPDVYISEITVIPEDIGTYVDGNDGELIVGDKLRLVFNGTDTYDAYASGG